MREITLERLQFLGYAGVALLVIGALVPLDYALGSSENAIDWGWGYIILGLAGLSAFLLHLRRFQYLLLTAGAAGVVCGVLAWRVDQFLSSVRGIGNPLGTFIGTAVALATQYAGYNWGSGWWVLGGGVVVLAAAALLKPMQATSRSSEHDNEWA